ncbi:MAG: HEPN domain-containing protein [Bacteroidaceae bacterium]|nr:HEPN domain-containing protein [Bacteroidaceae bacterium]
MSLKEEDRKVLVTLELERVTKTLVEMEVQRQNGLWGMVANRLYYSLFHAVSALLICDHHEVGTHRGAVNKFSLFYVKEGIFTVAEGKLYSQLQRLREDGDYNCSIDVDQMDVEDKIEPTRQLIDEIKQYIAEKQ